LLVNGRRRLLVNGRRCLLINGRRRLLVNGRRRLLVNGRRCLLINGRRRLLIHRRLWLLIDRWLWLYRCRRRDWRRLRLRGRQRIKKPYAGGLFVARPAHRGTIRHGVLLRHRAREALELSSGCSHERSIHELAIDYHLLRAPILNRLNLGKTFGSRSSESHNETHCEHNCPAPHNNLLDVFVHGLFRSQQRGTCSLKNVTAVSGRPASIGLLKNAWIIVCW